MQWHSTIWDSQLAEMGIDGILMDIDVALPYSFSIWGAIVQYCFIYHARLMSIYGSR